MVSKKLTMVGTTYKHYLTVSATVEMSKNGKPEAEREIKRTAWNHAKRIPNDASANGSRIRTYGILALGVSRGIGVPCDFLVVSRSVGG